tara:strand:+ start:12323 stop:13123 length:801 start_codon:yes stop_codon:yes gene_type:complete
MCGCYEVKFEFAETFVYTEDSTYVKSPPKTMYALELAHLIKDDKNDISIQHILQIGDYGEPYIIKHWRQDWSYQNQDFYLYDSNNFWKYKNRSKSEVKGQWSQKVYQVDDGPRYEGSGTWVHVDGKSYWESTTPAPLPRREKDIRSDYNLTLRGNRVEIMDYGWAHVQDNSKVYRKNEKNKVLAKEKGYNTYKKVEDERCKYALKWWEDNSKKWNIVQEVWNEIYNRRTDLKVSQSYNQKPLFMYLFVDDYEKKEDIKKLIDKFVD